MKLGLYRKKKDRELAEEEKQRIREPIENNEGDVYELAEEFRCVPSQVGRNQSGRGWEVIRRRPEDCADSEAQHSASPRASQKVASEAPINSARRTSHCLRISVIMVSKQSIRSVSERTSG